MIEITAPSLNWIFTALCLIAQSALYEIVLRCSRKHRIRNLRISLGVEDGSCEDVIHDMEQ